MAIPMAVSMSISVFRRGVVDHRRVSPFAAHGMLVISELAVRIVNLSDVIRSIACEGGGHDGQ